MSNIHSTAIISKSAQLADNVKVGAFSIIGPNVVLKEGVEIQSHVIIEGHTTIGENTNVFPFSSLGLKPQHINYNNEKTFLKIGKDNTIRENSVIHRGIACDNRSTIIGDSCYIMNNVHIAHNCIIGNNNIIAAQAALGGHVELYDFIFIGGCSAIHQFVRVGSFSMVSASAYVAGDVLPYSCVEGNKAYLLGLNLVGLKRKGFNNKKIKNINQAVDHLFKKDGTHLENFNSLKKFDFSDEVNNIINFIEKPNKKRYLCCPKGTI